LTIQESTADTTTTGVANFNNMESANNPVDDFDSGDQIDKASTNESRIDIAGYSMTAAEKSALFACEDKWLVGRMSDGMIDSSAETTVKPLGRFSCQSNCQGMCMCFAPMRNRVPPPSPPKMNAPDEFLKIYGNDSDSDEEPSLQIRSLLNLV
jgi:hypothetical protein